MIRGALLFLLLATAAGSQTLDIVAPYRLAVESYERGDLHAASRQLEELIAIHDRDAVATIGPAFGNVWYHLGLCRLERGDLAGAAAAFTRCHTDYANPPAGEGGNAFQTAATIKRAELEQAQGRFSAAAKLYAAALKQGPPDPVRHRLLMNVAVCLHETGDLERTIRICRTLLEDDTTRPELKRLAMLQSCRIAVEQHDVSAAGNALRRYLELPEIPVLERSAWTRALLHIGRRCSLLDDPALALRFYELAVSGWGAREAWSRQAALAATGFVVRGSPPIGEELGPELLLSRADAWFQLEGWRLARSGYEAAESELGQARRPQILHAASVCSAMLNEPDRAEDALHELLEAAPEYPMISEVLAAWIESLLRVGREREAREQALTERDRWTGGDYRREPLDFLAASAAFRLQQFGAAGLEFEAYLFQYPNAARKIEALYSRAVCHLHQRGWDDAQAVFDKLIDEDVAAEWIDGALYYRAFCRVMNDALQPAEDDLRRLLEAHPESPHRGDAWNLLGDLRFRDSAWEQAETMYVEAETSGQVDAAAYGAYQQIRIAIARSDPEHALALYRAFRERFLDSKELPEASAAIARLQESRGRAAEAIELLTGDILDRADRVRDAGLETLMHAHNALYKRTHGYQALITRLHEFPGPDPTPRPLAAWLALAEIEALESVGGAEDDARVQERYRFLAVEYELDQLDGIFVLKLARWLEQVGEIDSAISYYTMLTDLRDEPAFLQQARIERARMLRLQGDPAAATRALDDLHRVLDDTDSPEFQEAASVEIARHWFDAGEWGQARRWWERVLANSRWLMARGEASYGLAFCLDELGLRDEARRQYLNTYIHFEGQVDWSAPAFLRAALMAEEDGDSAGAAEVLDDMMSRMGHLDHPVVNRARTLHRQWRKAGES